ncbi:MAG: hypothetical protein ACREN6_03245 [Gemmatimonadaceae bacterium]
MRKRMIAMVVLFAAAGVAGCHHGITDAEAQANEAAATSAAEARLFTAMNRDNFDSAGDIISQLIDLRDKYPTNYRNTFILGAANFWWIAEASRPDAEISPLQIVSLSIPNILGSFSDVITNDPVNRGGADGLLGAFLSDAGLDKVTGAALVDSATIYAPQVGLFQQMSIRRFAVYSDTSTAQAIEWGFKWWEWCLGAPIDRNNPDFTGKVQPPTDGAKGFCWGSARVPHGFEGAWMMFGDLLVKGGQFQAARRAYLNAQLGVNYSTWKHSAELEARLASDLNQRYATYANTDPAKWAPIGNPSYGCTQCHASK